MTTRIYAIKRDDVVVNLVRATTPGVALAHQARSTWTAGKATQDDLVKAIGIGMKVVDAEAPEPAATTAALPGVPK